MTAVLTQERKTEGTMRIDAARAFLVRMPLTSPWKTSFGAQPEITTVLVRLDAEGASGWGEAAPGTWPAFCGEWGAPTFALTALLLLTVPLMLAGFLARANIFAILLGLFWFVILLGGFVVALVGIGLAVGWPLMAATVAVERTDAFDGISRAYASEIMWAAKLAPFARAASLDDDAVARLARAADAVLTQALDRARERITTDMPNKEARVTAVHGHHGEPCLRCGTRLEHVAFSEYDLVYCPACQTGGRVYRDRRMSRLLGG